MGIGLGACLSITTINFSWKLFKCYSLEWGIESRHQIFIDWMKVMVSENEIGHKKGRNWKYRNSNIGAYPKNHKSKTYLNSNHNAYVTCNEQKNTNPKEQISFCDWTIQSLTTSKITSCFTSQLMPCFWWLLYNLMKRKVTCILVIRNDFTSHFRVGNIVYIGIVFHDPLYTLQRKVHKGKWIILKMIIHLSH